MKETLLREEFLLRVDLYPVCNQKSFLFPRYCVRFVFVSVAIESGGQLNQTAALDPSTAKPGNTRADTPSSTEPNPSAHQRKVGAVHSFVGLDFQQSGTMSGRGKGKSGKKAVSRSSKAGLQFPVGRIARYLKKGKVRASAACRLMT